MKAPQRNATDQFTTREWIRGGFFLLAALLVSFQGTGLLEPVPAITRLIMVGLAFAFSAMLVAEERNSREFQMVALGLAILSVPVLAPAGVLPPVPLPLQMIGLQNWATMAHLTGGLSISVGALVYSKHLLTQLQAPGARPDPKLGAAHPVTLDVNSPEPSVAAAAS